MRAFLLAAGRGMRLRPLTDHTPKCLAPINGRPLLDIWIDLLGRHGIDRVLINTHHLAERVAAAVDRLRGASPVTIETVHEPHLLGSAGTIEANAAFIPEGEDFIIAYADNLTAVDLREMIGHHRRYRTSETLLTMGLFKTAMPTECGVAALDHHHRVTSFEEKPRSPVSDLANAGIYIAEYRLLEVIRRFRSSGSEQGGFDLGYDVLPRLSGRMIGYQINEFLMDIGTMAAYSQAQQAWAAIHGTTANAISGDMIMIDMKQTAHRYLDNLKEVMAGFDAAAFETAMHLIMDAYRREAHIFTMGNGGSGSTASHFACDINKGCCLDLDRKFKMICLNDNLPTMLAYANDVSYDAVFVEQLKNFFQPGDLVIGISGSGNSENVLRAVRYAADHGGRTIGMSGFDGGKLAAAVEVPLVAEVHDMQMVEDMHMIVVHMIMQATYRSLHGGTMAGAC